MDMILYDGRVVPKEGFRAFVYGPDNAQKLANSWIEYESLISSGLWFSTKEKAHNKQVKAKGGA